ncbi:MAG: alpha/beta fold hydrolase [Burkholderiales bacterium]
MMVGMLSTADAASPFPGAQEGHFVIRDFQFRSGEVLPELKVGYTLLGEPQRDAQGRITNAVLLLHGTTGTAQNWFLPGLAKSLYGPGQPLDRQRYFLIIPDGIGLGRSSKPSDGLKAHFPRYGYHDMVTANARLLQEGLHVDHLRAIVGTSMGGMQTWLFAERYPDFMDGAIAIASQPTAVSGRNMMWRQVLIESIRGAADWKGGDYTVPPESFVHVWPLFGIMTDGASHLQTIAPTRADAIAHYRTLSANARLLDANDMLYRFEASADYNPQPDLEKIKVPFLAINFQDDLLNPVELGLLQQEMPRVKQGKAVILSPAAPSLGHQNLGQGALWGPVAADFLENLPAHP